MSVNNSHLEQQIHDYKQRMLGREEQRRRGSHTLMLDEVAAGGGGSRRRDTMVSTQPGGGTDRMPELKIFSDEESEDPREEEGSVCSREDVLSSRIE